MRNPNLETATVRDTLIRASRAARRLHPDSDSILVHAEGSEAQVLVRQNWLISTVDYRNLDSVPNL